MQSLMPSAPEHRLERLGLADGAREAVEQDAALGVGLVEALLDELVDDVVRDEVAGLEDRGDLLAEFAAGLDGVAQDVAGRDVRDAVLLGEGGGLGSLTGALFPQDDQI